MLKVLENYGWELDYHMIKPFEFCPSQEALWVNLMHPNFTDISLWIEVKFAPSLSCRLMVSDDNCDTGGDQMDVLCLDFDEFDAKKIWEACEKVEENRRHRYDSL